ncbi:type II secretion system F family protein [Candidatus Magnetomonas plexicatena]|uniref:type II secretion system F family protein n=1 Tax=Candidatus Magnetomonas plexicatena TaxID=2552947 RepID=UPI001C77155A|nr:hypothetical protein E2O03_014035 [Nitrospirales bacterium LBB_01]
MPVFKYRGYNSEGRRHSGALEADNVTDALRLLKLKDIYPEKVVHENKTGFTFSITSDAGALKTLTAHLAVLVSSGVAIVDAMDTLSERRGGKLRSMLVSIKERLRAGASLSRAMEDYPKFFPDFYISMISAGETGGCLDSVLNELADFLESRDEMDSAVKSAAIYPAIMLTVGTFVLTFVFVFVVPKLVKIFEDSDKALPLATVILITMSNFLKNYLWALIAGIICLTYMIRRYVKTHALKVGEILTKIPVLNSLYVSRFLKTTGSLLKNGVPMLKTLRLSSKTIGNAFYERQILEAEKAVSEGLSLSLALSDFPPIVKEIILTGERTGALSDMLLKTSLTYEKEFKAGTKRALTALEPLIVLVMGFIVGFIVFAVLLPVFELNQLIR